MYRCVFESSASSELIVRLRAYPKMLEFLKVLPDKVLALSSSEPSRPVELPVEVQLETRVQDVTARIQQAKFTGKGDKDTVINLYKKYVSDIATALQKTFALASMKEQSHEKALPPIPTVAAPPFATLQLAVGQLLLLKDDTEGRLGDRSMHMLGQVDDAGRVSLVLAEGKDTEETQRLRAPKALEYDKCDHVMLPWRPVNDWDEEAIIRDVKALSDLVLRGSNMCNNLEELNLEPKDKVPKDDKAQLDKCSKEAKTILEAMEVKSLTTDLIEKEWNEIIKPAKTATQAVLSRIESPVDNEEEAARNMKRAVTELRKKLQKVPERLQDATTDAIKNSGMRGARRYAAGQWLSVQHSGAWRDAEVLAAGSEHRLYIEDEGEVSVALHPWNHAPRDLPLDAFTILHEWWAQTLQMQHKFITDALTGSKLNAMEQCVAIKVETSNAKLSSIDDVHGLSAWLHSQHSEREDGAHTTTLSSALLTGPPAAGKTTLISQVVLLALKTAKLVPILIKVQQLQLRLNKAPEAFASKWNWVDAYLSLVYADENELVYRMLRQVLMARRALILLDGLDEGGTNREAIEQHVAKVLAPQGHIMLCTSRPAGIVDSTYKGFNRLKLAPLTEDQQQDALTQRLGADGMKDLMPFIDKMPMDTKQKHRITANPLMLSMLASGKFIFPSSTTSTHPFRYA